MDRQTRDTRPHDDAPRVVLEARRRPRTDTVATRPARTGSHRDRRRAHADLQPRPGRL